MVKRKIWMFLVVVMMFFESSNTRVMAFNITECRNQCVNAASINVPGISSTNLACNDLCDRIKNSYDTGQSSEATLFNMCKSSYCPSTNSFGLADESREPLSTLCGEICSQMRSGGVFSSNDTTNSNTSSNSNYNPFCGDEKEINTALGCIPVEIKSFVPWLLGYLFGIAGGIAFLLMVYGFILIATSSGDEKKVAGAKETITSAIVGLLVCIFSIFILRLIAVNILQIPGI